MPKQALNNDALAQGATGGERVISTADQAVAFLKTHSSFTPQLRTDRKADNQGFKLKARQVDEADLSGLYGNSPDNLYFVSLCLANIEDDHTKTRRLHVIEYEHNGKSFDVENAKGYESYYDFLNGIDCTHLKFITTESLMNSSLTTDIRTQLNDL